MAKVYSAPIPAPDVSTDDLIHDRWQQIEKDYIDTLAAQARGNGSSPLLGEVVRFQRGDGYAQYLVWRTKPLELVWLEIGDAWSVEDALIRGLRVSDIREILERDKKMRALFGRRKP